MGFLRNSAAAVSLTLAAYGCSDGAERIKSTPNSAPPDQSTLIAGLAVQRQAYEAAIQRGEADLHVYLGVCAVIGHQEKDFLYADIVANPHQLHYQLPHTQTEINQIAGYSVRTNKYVYGSLILSNKDVHGKINAHAISGNNNEQDLIYSNAKSADVHAILEPTKRSTFIDPMTGHLAGVLVSEGVVGPGRTLADYAKSDLVNTICNAALSIPHATQPSMAA